jgi:hypothetical protein
VFEEGSRSGGALVATIVALTAREFAPNVSAQFGGRPGGVDAGALLFAFDDDGPACTSSQPAAGGIAAVLPGPYSGAGCTPSGCAVGASCDVMASQGPWRRWLGVLLLAVGGVVVLAGRRRSPAPDACAVGDPLPRRPAQTPATTSLGVVIPGGPEHRNGGPGRGRERQAPADLLLRVWTRAVASWVFRRAARAGKMLRRGLTATTVCLAVGAVVITALAWLRLPDTGLPTPMAAHLEIDFSHGYAPVADMVVDLQLMTNASPLPDLVTLGVDLIGPDFAQPNWSMRLDAPSGVGVAGTAERGVTVLPGSRGSGRSEVRVSPGAVPGGRYSLLLDWPDTRHGPVQVRGADLAAVFPDVLVNDQDAASPARAKVSWLLYVGRDFTFLVGDPPDRVEASGAWAWDPGLSGVSGHDELIPPSVQARSPSAEERAHTAEFGAGVLFGVAASVGVAAVQEFLRGAVLRRRKGRRSMQRAPGATAQ